MNIGQNGACMINFLPERQPMVVGSAEKHGSLTAEGGLFRSTGGNMIDSQLVICLILFALTCIGYVTNIWSLGTTALAFLVGCLPQLIVAAFYSALILPRFCPVKESALDRNAGKDGEAALSPAAEIAGAVPSIMDNGSCSQLDLVGGGWLYAVAACAVTAGWIMTVFPAR